MFCIMRWQKMPSCVWYFLKLPKKFSSGEDRESEAWLECDSKSESPPLFQRLSITLHSLPNLLHHSSQCFPVKVGSTVNMRHQAGGGDVKVKWLFLMPVTWGLGESTIETPVCSKMIKSMWDTSADPRWEAWLGCQLENPFVGECEAQGWRGGQEDLWRQGILAVWHYCNDTWTRIWTRNTCNSDRSLMTGKEFVSARSSSGLSGPNSLSSSTWDTLGSGSEVYKHKSYCQRFIRVIALTKTTKSKLETTCSPW